MPYNEKSKERTMKYLEKLKEIRFRVKPEEYARYEQAAKQGNYQSLRQFYMSAINEKVDAILNQPISQDEKKETKLDRITGKGKKTKEK